MYSAAGAIDYPLGMTGIGGKRSSGWGNYRLEDDPLELSQDDFYGGDDAALYKMLSSDHAEYYMTLSSFLPSLEEVKDAASGTGKSLSGAVLHGQET